MSIDIQEMLFQSIKLQEPLVKIHPNYQSDNDQTDEDEEEYGQGNVMFI
jgi:hypothetical protein